MSHRFYACSSISTHGGFMTFKYFWYVGQLTRRSQLRDFTLWLIMKKQWCDVEYKLHRVRIEGRTPIEERHGNLRFEPWTISSTPLAIEISTPWRFIVNINHPGTLSELHLHSLWAAPPPPAVHPLSCSWVWASLFLRVIWLSPPPSLLAFSLPHSALARPATPSRRCYRG